MRADPPPQGRVSGARLHELCLLRWRHCLHPPLEGEGSVRIVRCEPGWGDSLSASTVCQSHRFRLTRTVQLNKNSLEHGRQIVVDLGIPKSDDAIAFLLKPKLSFAVAFGGFIFAVMSAIQLNDQPFRWAEEIHDIPSDRRLPPEMRAVRRKLLERAP